jgi:hypothetical protein
MEQDPHAPDELDCHPLLREYFGEQLQAANPAAWREANKRLYEYYKSTAKEYPDTMEEMAPLYAAVMHGCQAGKHREALIEIYLKRIQRGARESFNTKKLGAIGSEIAILSNFFDVLWAKPVFNLEDRFQGYVLSEVGFDLRALGRLVESTQPIQVGLEISVAQKDWLKCGDACQ